VSAGLPLREALKVPALQKARLLAGAAGLDRAVRYVNVMEVPDILDWVKPDELLLTTAYPLRDDRAALADLVPRLADRGLAGLAVKPARYLDAVPQVMLEAAERLSFPLLELPPETAMADIINAVLGLILNVQALRLERSAAIHERFTAIALGGGGVRDIVQALTELLDRPAALLDSQGVLLARSPGFPAHAAAELLLDGRAATGLRWAVLAADGPLADEQRMALEQAATIAALRLVQERAVAEADDRFRAVCLDELVTGHVSDAAVLHERATAFGWNLSRPRAVLVAEIDALDGRRFGVLAGTSEETRACRGLADAARAVLGDDAIVWERSAGAAALTSSNDLRRDAAALQAEARRRLPRAVVSVGVGRTQADPLELRTSYAEALRSLEVGRWAGGQGVVSLFADLGLDRLLMSCPVEELAAFHSATLGPLLAYEREHADCGLSQTLAAFVAADRNVAETARALFVHYNTVKYRLDRLERLLGPFVNHPTRRLTLELAVHVGRLLQR
jgi:purine catabolism regulator